MCLVEPYIEDFEKFNSNSGWAPVTGNLWSDVMQALSHFSYHNSGGQYLLCSLQGGSTAIVCKSSAFHPSPGTHKVSRSTGTEYPTS